jgi:predicted nucleic acid-binding protein
MVVLDTSFLVAFHNRRDAHHAAAARGMEELLSGGWGPALLLEYVFVEVVTVLMARRNLETATRVGDILLEARETELIPCSEIFAAAFDTFRRQPGDDLSFTDAAIVTVARQRGARFVATFDGDFEGLAGITVVPGRD